MDWGWVVLAGESSRIGGEIVDYSMHRKSPANIQYVKPDPNLTI
jgi:hypothetical protein